MLIAAALLAGCGEKKSAPGAPGSAAAASAPPTDHGPTALRRLIGNERCPAETRYVDCMIAACDAVYRECYGPDVGAGRLRGPCKEYGDCSLGCLGIASEEERGACALSCLDQHRKDGSACETCSGKLFDCTMKGACTPPSEGCP